MRVRHLTGGLLVILLVAVGLPIHQSQASGRGPIRILVGFAAGGTTDVAARLIADRLREELGRPVVVENRPGASGRIAVESLRASPPDGATLLLVPMVVPVLLPLTAAHPGHDPARDLAPVAHVANFQVALAVSADHPARRVPEFVAWAKSAPGRTSFGTPAAGGLPHCFGMMVGQATGLEMVHVPYKGVAPLAVDLTGGHIPAGLSAVSDLLELHRGGKIRIIGTSGTKRSPLLPAVPTFAEQGFPAIEGHGWIAFFASAGTPRDVIEQWSRVIVRIVASADVTERLVQLGLEPTGTTPEGLAAIIAADTVRWAPVIKAAGLRSD